MNDLMQRTAASWYYDDIMCRVEREIKKIAFFKANLTAARPHES